ncbi:hypothetical protein J3R82DRAFT_6772 [Butyriboletus roseoflavus]|nr:hypothetical protein J3R82DRAFT_6772 [Butyriboletus roseoflavus]
MKGYLAFPPPSPNSSTPFQPSKAASTSACTTWTHPNRHDSDTAGHPNHAETPDDHTMEAERRHRRERERALAERSEIEWVRAGGVLRDAYGRRDVARTARIRQELRVQDVERERMARWQAYEARWRAMQSSSAPIAFVEFPWPLAEGMSSRELSPLTRASVTGFLFESLAVRTNTTTKKERIRVSLLRWHPDKISFVLARVVPEDLGLVREGIHVVFSILKALQDAERMVAL